METKTIEITTEAMEITTAAWQTVAVISVDYLVKMLFAVRGVTFISAETTTVPDMGKGGRDGDNYLYGNVVKDSVVHCMMGHDYETRRDTVAAKKWVLDTIESARRVGISEDDIKKSIKTLSEFSRQAIEKFVAKPRKWGKHMVNPHTDKVSRIMIDHTKKDGSYNRYMQVEILGAKTPVYRYKNTGEVLSDADLTTVKKYLKPRTDDDLIIRDYGIDNIKKIRINKESFIIQ